MSLDDAANPISFEYKVVAAPKKIRSVKGVNSHEDTFATNLAEVMNVMARENWEYLRAESLPCEEKTGLTSRVESYQSVLVFRRQIVADKKFFEVPNTHQLELHKIDEDKSEVDFIFSSSQNQAETAEPDEAPTDEADRGAPSGVLGILRNRKAKMLRQEASNDTAPLKMAGE